MNYIKKFGYPSPERYVLVLAVLWTVFVSLSLIWNLHQMKQKTLETAHIQARSAYLRDIIYRRWNARHGGVYVPVTEETQPNPYLSGIPERDITTLSGKLLTLMNPAYMTRQVHELGEEEYGIYSHITSLNPIRSGNAPDRWENEALQAFERGETEIFSVEEIRSEDHLRLMQPLITEKSCLKCHAAQGYKEGDIRGGISVSIPMEPLWAIRHIQMLTLSLGHGLLWLIGLGGICLWMLRLRRSESDLKQAEEALQKARDDLEIREKRTSELKIVNEQIRKEIIERERIEEELNNHKEHLEELVKDRNAELEETTEELKEKVSFLERYYDATVERELKMKELRVQIEELEKKL